MSRGLGNKMKRKELETSRFSSKFPAKSEFERIRLAPYAIANIKKGIFEMTMLRNTNDINPN